MLIALALSTLLSSTTVAAGDNAACHCYRERTYDPLRPDAADGYIVATARSSLLSAAFGPSKRELVQAVMTGTSPDDLFIAHWAGAYLGRSAGALLEAKSAKGGSWKTALAGASGLDARFGDALARGAPDADLAAAAIDETLATRLHVDRSALAAVRATGAATGDVLVAAVLAARLGTTPATVLTPIRAGKATWGSALQALGLAPHDLDGVVRDLAAR